MNIFVLLALAYDGVLAAVCLYAMACGGRPERIGATLCFGGSLVTVLLRWLRIASGAPAEIVVLAVDCAVGGGFF